MTFRQLREIPRSPFLGAQCPSEILGTEENFKTQTLSCLAVPAPFDTEEYSEWFRLKKEDKSDDRKHYMCAEDLGGTVCRAQSREEFSRDIIELNIK